MSDPAKVINFLDIAALPTGGWDPSLAFVMAGAIGVGFFGFRAVLARPHPIYAAQFQLPPTRGIDARILVGPAIFGIGWGLAGFCPGPAFVALGAGSAAGAGFVVAMFAGMAIARGALRRTAS
jgi:hypothetical protein